MQWWAITGSWRHTNPGIERDVRNAVHKIIETGDRIVSGGALNVDYHATDEALALCPSGKQIKIIIPTPLNLYAAHYRKRADEGIITHEQAENLIKQLTHVQSLGSLTEMTHAACNEKTYYDRNTKVIEAATAGVLAFQVNDSGGVQDMIDKARQRNMQVSLKTYNVMPTAKDLIPILETERIKCSGKKTTEHFLRPLIYDMLQAAAASLPDGFYFLIYEGYRPRSRQIEGWNRMMARLKKEYPDEDEQRLTERCKIWVANPFTKGSGHQAGAAIDLTICRADGTERDMGTVMGECNHLTAFDAPGLTEQQRKNRASLRETMTKAGFVNYPAEWWHYSYGDRLWAEVLKRPATEIIFQPYMDE